MDIKYIKELMKAMKEMEIDKVCISNDDVDIELERTRNVPEVISGINYQAQQPLLSASAPITHQGPALTENAGSGKIEVSGKTINSPVVGTFYTSPAPNEPVFVKKGDRITEDSVVCIVEAMKVMNEVKADMNGIISEILVEDAHPVEFGTPLFKVI